MNQKALLFIFVMLLVSSSIILEMPAPSFSSIQQSFFTTEKKVGLIVSYSLLGAFLGSLLYGPISDIFGRKKILFYGNLIMAIGSFGCLFAQSIYILIFFRFIQGIGSACSLVLIPVIINDLYKIEEAGKFYKINNAFIAIFTAIAPIVGGFVNDYFGWRWNFGIIFIFGTLSLFSIFFFKEKDDHNLNDKEISIQNIFSEYRSLFKNSMFLISSFASNLIYGNFLVFLTYTPFLYIQIYGLPAAQYSMHQGVAVLAFSLANFALRFAPVQKDILFLKVGMISALFGAGGIFFINSPNLITFFVCFSAIGAAMTFPTLSVYSINCVDEKIRGAGSSFTVASRYLICGIVIYLVSNGYDGTAKTLSIFMFSISLIISIMIVYLFVRNFFKLESANQ